MKTNLSRNALIGLAFIVSLVMLYFGINFLKGTNVFKKQNKYYALFEDVSQLLVSSPVYVKGYQIGLISRISMASDDPMRFAVEINFEDKFRITRGSYVEYATDMFGASTVKLIMAEDGDFLQPGDTIMGGKEKGLMDGVTEVMPKADSILMRVDSMVFTLNRLMSHPMWEKSIEGIGGTVEQLNQSSVELNRMMGALQKDLPVISGNLNAVSGDLKNVTNELSRMDLQKTFVSIDETVTNLKTLSDKMNSSDNSLGLLLNGTSLHDSITVTINTATQLLEDIRLNPERYLSVRVRLF